MRVKDKLLRIISLGLAATMLVAAEGIAIADGSGDPTAVKKSDSGEYYDKDGNPTYKVESDGTGLSTSAERNSRWPSRCAR